MNIDANEIENASMLNIRGELMSGDRVTAVILDSVLQDCDDACLPYYLKRTQNLQSWLALRGTGRIRACFGDCTG